jgi:hypothetical protein
MEREIGLLVDSGYVYVSTWGALLKVPVAGGPAIKLAPIDGSWAQFTLAVDATSVYFASVDDLGGGIHKVTPK